MALVFNTPKSALNTTSKDIQNLSSDCPPCPEVNLTTADVEYTENGEYTVTPEEGYDGLTQVDITVNIPSDVRNQDKLVTPTTSYQTITADSGYSGIGTVSVEAVTSSIDANIAAGNIKKNVSILGVTGSYDPQPTLQAKTATPTTSQQVIEPDNDKDGLSSVTVSAVTSSIDANISAGNIKKDVTILGVTGNYDPQPDLETKTVTYTTNDTYTITPTAGKDGISSATITVNVASSNCPDWSTIGWDCSDVNASQGDLKIELSDAADFKRNFDDETITSFANSTLMFAPKVTLPTDCSNLFENCKKLKFLPRYDFSGVTSTSGMFSTSSSGDTLFTNVDFYLPDATDISSMFAKNSRVINLNSASINAPNATTAYRLFKNNSGLGTVSLTFGTDKLTSTGGMFEGCRSLSYVPLFDTSEVTSCSTMFKNCYALDTMPAFDFSKAQYASGLFTGCRALTSIPNMNIGTEAATPLAIDFDQSGMTALTSVGLLNIPMCTILAFPNSANLTTLAGFNVGGGLKGSVPLNPMITLTANTQLTKQSLLNVLNTVPDRTGFSTSGTIALSTTSYALLDASEIAIATAKNWTVTTS